MALLALTGFRSWANPVVSSPSGSNDGEYYNITVNNQTPSNWTLSCQSSQIAGYSVQISYTPKSGCESYVAHFTCVNDATGNPITVSSFDELSGTYYGEFTMPASSVTLTASFEAPVTYNVYQAQLTGGSIYVAPSTGLTAGTIVSVYVYPDTQNHYTFDAAHYQDKISVEYGDGQHVQVGAYNNYYYFTMPAADVTVNVIFDEEPNYSITVNNPEGCTITVNSQPKYYVGREIYFEYEMASGYRFNSWDVKYDDNFHVSPQPVTVYDNKPWNGDYYFIMPEGPVTITANVTQVTTHTITVVQPSVGGTISVSTNEATVGDPVYIYTNPAQGYTLNKWYVKNENGDVVLEDVTAGFYMPDFNVTVTADFVLEPVEEEITVFEGTSTDEHYPIYTYWGDTQGTTSQFIIPAEELGDLANSKIKGLRFKLSDNNGTGNQKWDCSLAEVNYKELTGIVTEGLTPVYQGHALSFTNESDGTYWVVNFDSQFQYNGGNLLISFEVSTIGGCPHDYFYGTYTGYGYNTSYNNRESGSAFIPQTTITYLTTNTCKAPKDLAASEITGTGATISWTGNGAESYDIAYGVAATFDLSNSSTYILQDGLTTTSVQLTGLTAETEYKCAVKAHCDANNASNWSKPITFMPSSKMDLTVNDGTNTNCYVPVYADNAWSSTKSQFIIPAEQLQSMFDGTITDLTFYADLGGFNFGDARWNVYVKEVDYQTLNGLVSTEGMTLVYNGGMTIADNKLHIDFDTDYTYSDNNLLVYFELTQGGSSNWLLWYGVNTSNNTSYTWYDAYWGESSFGVSFLPKTTIRYSASDNPQTRYAITVNQPEVGGTISASKALAVEGCTITLTATPAEGYVFGSWVVYDEEGSIDVTDNQFAVRASNVTVTAVYNALPRYNVS